jgi:hypothetical protein
MNQTTAAQVTFAVDPVQVGRELLPTEKVHASVQKLLGTPIEASDNYHADVVEQPGFHSLIGAAHLAYQHHYPLVLSPDVIWLTIAQGLANHINNHAEELRPRFVPGQGKAVIQVRRDDFVKGSPENPWAEVWPEFSKQIKQVIGPESHAWILSDFSTTGPTERAASEVVLMDCVQSYFSYECMTLCGIPAVTLEGTAEDWESVHRRAEGLQVYGLRWWTDDLLRITSEFVAAATGDADGAFWRAMYKQQDDSGGPYTTGWLVRLLPYLKHREYKYAREGDFQSGYATPWKTDRRNFLLGRPLVAKPEPFEGVTDPHLPSSASQVPFLWRYLGQDFEYQFVAGILAIEQDKASRALRPRIGWAVRPAPKAG